MIVFDNVVLRYPYDEFDVLKGVGFTLTEGVNTILADAQSGKSTICKLLVKDIAATGGQIFVDGRLISSITNSNLDILYLPSNPVFFKRRSVGYNIQYPLKIRKVPKQQRQAVARELAAKFGLDFDAKVAKLSKQQQRTLALARGLSVKRKTALLDSFLDGETPNFEYINSIAQNFDCCVILTSNPQFAVGHTVVLDGGVTVYEGDANEARQVVSNLHWLSQD